MGRIFGLPRGDARRGGGDMVKGGEGSRDGAEVGLVMAPVLSVSFTAPSFFLPRPRSFFPFSMTPGPSAVVLFSFAGGVVDCIFVFGLIGAVWCMMLGAKVVDVGG